MKKSAATTLALARAVKNTRLAAVSKWKRILKAAANLAMPSYFVDKKLHLSAWDNSGFKVQFVVFRRLVSFTVSGIRS